MIEKFVDAEQMEKSYENLEKEFTKKCQELSRVKKELEELTKVEDNTLDHPQVEQSVVEEELEEPKNESAPVESEVIGQEQNTSDVSFGLGFREKASEFLMKNPTAKNYAKDIAKILLTDSSLLSVSDPFEVAYALALKSKRMEEKLESKPQSVVEEKLIKPAVPVLGKTTVGFSPAKSTPKFRTFEDARDELINRYFG